MLYQSPGRGGERGGDVREKVRQEGTDENAEEEVAPGVSDWIHLVLDAGPAPQFRKLGCHPFGLLLPPFTFPLLPLFPLRVATPPNLPVLPVTLASLLPLTALLTHTSPSLPPHHLTPRPHPTSLTWRCVRFAKKIPQHAALNLLSSSQFPLLHTRN